jgi:hypothetical protein
LKLLLHGTSRGEFKFKIKNRNPERLSFQNSLPFKILKKNRISNLERGLLDLPFLERKKLAFDSSIN